MSTSDITTAVSSLPFERRQATRFPIMRQLTYRVLGKYDGSTAGLGQTLNMSRTGVLFTAQHHLPLGSRVEVAISWPAALNNQEELLLVARGCIESNRNGHFVLFIQQHKFLVQR